MNKKIHVVCKSSPRNLLGGLLPTHSWRQVADAVILPVLTAALIVWACNISWNFMIGGIIGGLALATFIWGLYAECELHIRPPSQALLRQVTDVFDDLTIVRRTGSGIYADKRSSQFFSHWKLVDSKLVLTDAELLITTPAFLAKLVVSKLKLAGYEIEESNLSSYKLT